MLLELEQKLYSISAIRKALYELSDTFTHTIETNDTHFLLNLTLFKKDEVDEKEIETLVTNKINDYRFVDVFNRFGNLPHLWLGSLSIIEFNFHPFFK